MAFGVNDLLTVSFRGTLFGQRTLTSYGYRVVSSTSTNSDATDLSFFGLAIDGGTGNTLLESYLDCCVAGFTINQIWTQKIYPVRSSRNVLTHTEAGAYAADVYTPNVSATITRKTALAGRDQMSTIHIPGPPLSTQSVAGTWESNYQLMLGIHGLASTAQITFTSGTASITVAPCIINAPYGSGLSSDLVGYEVNPRVRVMRRRTVGLGE